MEPKEKGNLTLEYVLRELGLEDNDVVNVTQIGSRVYGTAGTNSDWDFVSVVVNGFFEKHGLSKEKDAMRDNGFVSSTLTELDDWQIELDRHMPSPVICQYAPSQCIWRRQHHFEFTLCLSKLKAQFMSQSRYQKARTIHHAAGDYDKMKKWIVHAFRWLLVAKQLVQNPNLQAIDFTCANDLFYEVMAMDSTQWKDYDNKYRERWHALLEEVFPRDMKRDDFLDPSLARPIAELNRAREFLAAGAFDNQVDHIILNIVRRDLLTEKQFQEQYPDFVDNYFDVRSKFCSFCEEVQSIYYNLRTEVGEIWDDPERQKEVAEIINRAPKFWISILFYLKKSNQANVREMFAGDEKEAYLKEAIFSPEKFRNREELKSHTGKNKTKVTPGQ